MGDLSKIISILLLFFSILFFSYVFYRSEIYHNGILFHYYYKYYVIASCFLIISFISFFIRKNLKINISIFFLSILIGLYIIEGYLNLKYKKFSIYKAQTGKDYDKRDRFEIFQDLKKKDPKIVVSPPVVYFNDSFNIAPLSGIANSKTIHCNENGYYSIYQSDRYGFNNPDLEWNKNVIDFLLIGDSITRGACVYEPDTISGKIKKLRMNENGILNLGQTGNGPLRIYATLREYLPLKNVKRVLWMYSEGSDLKELNEELKHQILIKYLNNKNFTQNLVSNKDKVQSLLFSELNNVEEMMRQNMLKAKRLKRNSLTIFLILTKVRIYFFESLFYNYRATNYPFSKQEFQKILRLANQLVNENKAKLYFVYLPSYSRFQLNNNNDKFMKYKEVLDIVKNLKIPIIDINKELFDKHDDPLSLFPFRETGYHNVLGYELVAKKILNKIKELEE